jgi:chorismate mutase
MSHASSVRALRGATTVEPGVAPPTDAARDATQDLLRTLLEVNGLTVSDVVSAIFTLTPDLYEAAPARAAREGGWHEVPMITASEAPAEHSLARCIRVLVHVETARPRSAMRHVYLHGARVLRPDLVDELPRGHES